MTVLARPSLDAQMLEHATVAGQRSTCSRLQVGAVLPVDDGRLILSGRNGAWTGVKHCQHPSDDPCAVSVHAEQNLLLTARAYGFYAALRGGTVYVTHAPCRDCARALHQDGVTRVVYREAYRSVAGLDYLAVYGIRTEQHT